MLWRGLESSSVAVLGAQVHVVALPALAVLWPLQAGFLPEAVAFSPAQVAGAVGAPDGVWLLAAGAVVWPVVAGRRTVSREHARAPVA